MGSGFWVLPSEKCLMGERSPAGLPPRTPSSLPVQSYLTSLRASPSLRITRSAFKRGKCPGLLLLLLFAECFLWAGALRGAFPFFVSAELLRTMAWNVRLGLHTEELRESLNRPEVSR